MAEISFNSSNADKLLSYLELASKPTVVLSTGFFRQYTCPSNCGSCCHKITLAYSDKSDRWERFKELYPQHIDKFKLESIQGVDFWVDNQSDHKDRFCRHLDLSTGRCNVHDAVPFPCEFVLSKFIDNKSRNRSLLTTTNYGRGWSFLRVDRVSRGAMCEIIEFSFDKLLRDLDLLYELYDYAREFQIKTKLPYIILYLEKNLEKFKSGEVPTESIIFTQENTL